MTCIENLKVNIIYQARSIFTLYFFFGINEEKLVVTDFEKNKVINIFGKT